METIFIKDKVYMSVDFTEPSWQHLRNTIASLCDGEPDGLLLLKLKTKNGHHIVIDLTSVNPTDIRISIKIAVQMPSISGGAPLL